MTRLLRFSITNRRLNLHVCLLLVIFLNWSDVIAKPFSPTDDASAESSETNLKRFLELERSAKLVFPSLKPTEIEILHSLASRKFIYKGTGTGSSVRGIFLEWIFTAPSSLRFQGHRGLLLQDLKIDGTLDLSFAKLTRPLLLVNCVIDGDLNLGGASLPLVTLRGTKLDELSAPGIRLIGGIDISQGFRARRTNLSYSTIDRYVIGNNGVFESDIDFNWAKIGAYMQLRHALIENGGINATGASIGGNLDLDGARILHGIKAQGVQVGGSIFGRQEFESRGKIDLSNSRITGNVEFERSRLLGSEPSLLAQSARIAGSLFFRNGAEARYGVDIVGARIGGDIDLHAGIFGKDSKGNCFLAERSSVEGSIYFRGGFEAIGKVSFSTAYVKGGFHWTAARSISSTKLDLQNFKVTTLHDGSNSWPPPNQLLLDGLTYRQFAVESPNAASARIEWLRRQPRNRFSTQPYEHLADVFYRIGDKNAAQQVLVAKVEDSLANRLLLPHEAVYYWILSSVGYGYKPAAAFKYALIVVLAGWIVFSIGRYYALLTCSRNESSLGNTEIDNFSALVYSLDLFIPIVDFRYAEQFSPNSDSRRGRFLRYYVWFHIAAGWAICTILVAAFTGFLRV